MANLKLTSPVLLSSVELLVHDRLEHHRQLLIYLSTLDPYKKEYVYIRDAYDRLRAKIKRDEKLLIFAINLVKSPRQKMLLSCRFLKGMRHDEIAVTYPYNVRTITNHMRTAIKALAKTIVGMGKRNLDLAEWEIRVS